MDRKTDMSELDFSVGLKPVYVKGNFQSPIKNYMAVTGIIDMKKISSR
ncbi:MAG: hypothetical protein SGI89_03695 [bacterium]|nr:hypothetical protein [bacterium]